MSKKKDNEVIIIPNRKPDLVFPSIPYARNQIELWVREGIFRISHNDGVWVCDFIHDFETNEQLDTAGFIHAIITGSNYREEWKKIARNFPLELYLLGE